jgi:hypothetical protein
MNAPNISATDKPDVPGKWIKRYNIPLTPATANMNRNPLRGVSILKAAIKANT